MCSKILQTAVIGLGRIGWQTHLPLLQKNTDKFRICAVVDPIAERGMEAEKTFGVEHHYCTLEEMLAEQTPDLAIVCSPTMFHADQTIQLLRHGVHVFCDKPVAENLERTHAMFEEAKKADRKLMVFQPRRTFPNSFAIKQIMESGKLGKIYQMKLFIHGYGRRNDWQAFRKHGGGMLRNYGAHYVDQMMYLIGEPLVPLMCHTDCIASLGDADDVCKIVLHAPEKGVLVDVDINQASGQQVFVWALYGKNGAAVLRKYDNHWTLRYFDPAELGPNQACEDLAAPDRKYPQEIKPIPFREEDFYPVNVPDFAQCFYDNLYDYIQNNAEPIVPPADTIALMKTLEQCRIMAEGK